MQILTTVMSLSAMICCTRTLDFDTQLNHHSGVIITVGMVSVRPAVFAVINPESEVTKQQPVT